MKKIIIEFVEHSTQRVFDGKHIVGDWFFDEKTDDLHVKISDLGDWRYNFIYARHEMDEALLCRHNNIAPELIDYYCSLPKSANVDADSLSGYGNDVHQSQHNDALVAEWVISRLLHVNWKEYGLAVERVKQQDKEKRHGTNATKSNISK